VADEPIQIVVEDKVQPSIAIKLDDITKKARTGFDAINRMKAALRNIDGGALNALSLANSRAQKAMNDSALTAQKLQTETQKTASATIQAATAQQRLQTAATQTATAQQALAASAARAATAQTQQAVAASNAAAAQSRAALAALRLQQAQDRANKSLQDAARDGERLKRELFPIYDAQQRFNEAVARANTLLAAGAIEEKTYAAAVLQAKNALLQATTAQNTFNNGQTKLGKGAQINRAHLTNLGFQLNDIAVSLASGQNPLIVLVQQGSQIAGIASQAGVGLGRLAAAAGRMLLPFVPLAAVLATFVGTLKLVASEASKGANLEQFAKNLGASDKEIKSLNLNVVTLGDSLRGLWKTIDDATGINKGLAAIGKFFKDTFTSILKFVANTFFSIVSLGRAAVDTIVEVWQTFPQRFHLFIANAANLAISAFETFVNFSIKGINLIIDGLNKLSPKDLPNIAEIAFARIDTSKIDAPTRSLVQTFVDSYMQNMESQQGTLDKFIADWQKNSVDAAKNRIKTALRDEKAEESRAVSLAKINEQLDNERERMFKLRPEREAQAKFDQIEETLLGKKIKLNAEEARSIRTKIDAIQAGIVVQGEFDRIYEAGVAPLRTYTATLDAAAKIVKEQPELYDAATRAINQSREAYLNSLDPLRQINKEIDQQNALLALMPREREVAQQMQQIENQLLSAGIILTREQTEALQGRLQVQQQLNLASQAEAQIWEATAGARESYLAQLQAIAKLKRDGAITGGEAAQQVISSNPGLDFSNTQTEKAARVQGYADMYQKIQDLRNEDLINEQTAATLRLRIWSQEQMDRFRLAEQMFGNIESLTSSKHKTLFKIGKAAAIANATITGTQAVMNAAAVQPWYVGAALAVTAAVKAAQQIAQIRATEMPGFMRGGWTGNMPTNQPAGLVHGREFVFDAPATARIGPENLERLRSGNGSAAAPNVTIVNYGTSKTHEVQQISPNDIRIIARDVADGVVKEKTGKIVASQIADSNSMISKSLDRNTETRRRRS
jgi:hypothetical protein